MSNFAKRLFDIVFAVLFLTILSPVYIITSILIMISSPGAPIYKARRMGLNGKAFTCYKFRSMRVNSGKVRLTTLRNDDRIFPFGKFIRKTKIDELPQALNILFGQMSIVGPRPEDEANANKIYIGKYRKIYNVKPGLTSPASLYDFTHGEKYESEEAYEREFLPQKLDLEIYYVENQNFRYDLKIIVQTAITIFLVMLGKDVPKPAELAIIQSERNQKTKKDEGIK